MTLHFCAGHMAHEGRCPKTEKKMKGVAAAPEVKAASCCTVGSEDWDPVEVDLLLEELQDIPVPPEKKGKSSKVSGGDKDPGKGENTQLKVGSEDWDPVEVDLLLEELRDIPVTPEKKGKNSKVSGRDKDTGKGENTQLKKMPQISFKPQIN
ncbi:UNVERIFIED_CONTAM: hypothetical protein FKN15_063430 [Acipenser sinensis]